jgi:hypothetical protein
MRGLRHLAEHTHELFAALQLRHGIAEAGQIVGALLVTERARQLDEK